MIEEVQELEVEVLPAGPRGLSAYDIYVKNGGTLSEGEWLKSLNGLTPTIGENGNWFLGTVDTGLPSRGPKGDTGSIKFVVVTELPTENIDETAIYLKPVESPTGENKFEELIYVNGKWEDLGTPNVAVDLSNYYTKEEIGALTNLSTKDKSNLVNAINEVASSGGSEILTNYTDGNKEIAQKAIDAMKKGKQVIIIKKPENNSGNNGVYGPMYVCSPTLSVSEDYTGTIYFKSNYFTSIGYNDYNSTKELEYLPYFYQLTISVTNGVVTSAGNIYSNSNYNNRLSVPVLSKENKSAYTPTGDYNPATKKYVDDLTGDLTTLSTEDKSSLVNAINEVASSSGNNLPIYDLEVKLDASLAEPSLDSEDRLKCENIINDAYAKGYKNCAILLRSSTKNSSYLKAISLTFSTMDTSSQLTQYQFGSMYNTDDSSIHTNLYFNIYGTWSNNVFTCTNSFVRYENSKKYLSTNNTTSYTPTSDYHPSTKKYVDDAIASAITTSLEASY